MLKQNNDCHDKCFGFEYLYDYICPKCRIFARKHSIAVWEIGHNRLKVNKKWYYFFWTWHELRPLQEGEKKILNNGLNKADKEELAQHLGRKFIGAFQFR
jgi:hypothetical protein